MHKPLNVLVALIRRLKMVGALDKLKRAFVPRLMMVLGVLTFETMIAMSGME